MAQANKIPLVKSADPLDEEMGPLQSKNSMAKDQLHKEQLQLESRATICGLPVQIVAGLCYCIGTSRPTGYVPHQPLCTPTDDPFCWCEEHQKVQMV